MDLASFSGTISVSLKLNLVPSAVGDEEGDTEFGGYSIYLRSPAIQPQETINVLLALVKKPIVKFILSNITRNKRYSETKSW